MQLRIPKLMILRSMSWGRSERRLILWHIQLLHCRRSHWLRSIRNGLFYFQSILVFVFQSIQLSRFLILDACFFQRTWSSLVTATCQIVRVATHARSIDVHTESCKVAMVSDSVCRRRFETLRVKSGEFTWFCTIRRSRRGRRLENMPTWTRVVTTYSSILKLRSPFHLLHNLLENTPEIRPLQQCSQLHRRRRGIQGTDSALLVREVGDDVTITTEDACRADPFQQIECNAAIGIRCIRSSLIDFIELHNFCNLVTREDLFQLSRGDRVRHPRVYDITVTMIRVKIKTEIDEIRRSIWDVWSRINLKEKRNTTLIHL